ncbi:MAG: CAP domain-containing protein [Terriglobales bacterium]
MLRGLALLYLALAVSLGPCGAQPRRQSVLANATSSDASSSGEDLAAENELLEAANKSRALAGAPPLRIEKSLREAARAHARIMVANQRLEHQLPGEAALLERIAQVIPLDSPLKLDRAGENIANATCALGANEALMRSEPHRKNLLDRGFTVAGIAAIWSKGHLYVVQDFAHEVPSYSPQQTRELVSRAVDETRQQAGLPKLTQRTPPNLDEAACSLATENRPNAHLLATAYDNRKIVAYTQSQPDALPPGARRLLRDPSIRQFEVGSCYARNAAYPTGMYWIAILLY